MMQHFGRNEQSTPKPCAALRSLWRSRPRGASRTTAVRVYSCALECVPQVTQRVGSLCTFYRQRLVLIYPMSLHDNRS